MLRDRLVCGIRNDRIQQKLLAESDLTFDSAVKLASAIERAEQNLKDLHTEGVSDVNIVSQSSSTRRQPRCYRCGKANHHPNNCRFKNADCFTCSKKGRKLQMFGNNVTNKSDTPNIVQNDAVDLKDDADTDDGLVYAIYTISHKRVQPLQVILKLNGVSIKMEIDTGASLSIINSSTFDVLRTKDRAVRLLETPVRFRTYECI